jgi:hypothetical protein
MVYYGVRGVLSLRVINGWSSEFDVEPLHGPELLPTETSIGKGWPPVGKVCLELTSYDYVSGALDTWQKFEILRKPLSSTYEELWN